MCNCFVSMSVSVPYVCLVTKEVSRGAQIPGTGVMGDCEPPHKCWEPDQGPLQEQ